MKWPWLLAGGLLFFLVVEAAIHHADYFIDGIAQLQTTILDMHRGAAVLQIAAVDVGNAAGRRAAVPVIDHAVTRCTAARGRLGQRLAISICDATPTAPCR